MTEAGAGLNLVGEDRERLTDRLGLEIWLVDDLEQVDEPESVEEMQLTIVGDLGQRVGDEATVEHPSE